MMARGDKLYNSATVVGKMLILSKILTRGHIREKWRQIYLAWPSFGDVEWDHFNVVVHLRVRDVLHLFLRVKTTSTLVMTLTSAVGISSMTFEYHSIILESFKGTFS